MPASPPSPPARASWKLHDGRAELLAAAPLAGGVHVDLAHPRDGLSTGRGDRLLGLDLDPDRSGGRRPPLDAWVRCDDLTATWETGGQRGLRATALWRRRDAGADASAWELVASATTAKLHADSTLAVVSDVAATTVLSSAWHDGRPTTFDAGADRPGRGLLLVRRGDGTSCLVMLHPLEHQTVTVDLAAGRARIACWLFASGVEKGVLLRSRVLAAVGPAEGDLVWAGKLAAAFAALPPELAT